jgi:hypothetical protein
MSADNVTVAKTTKRSPRFVAAFHKKKSSAAEG